MASNYTTNYQLPKWEKTDRVQMKDFNDMTATLDEALHSIAVSAEAAQAAVDSEAAARAAAGKRADVFAGRGGVGRVEKVASAFGRVNVDMDLVPFGPVDVVEVYLHKAACLRAGKLLELGEAAFVFQRGDRRRSRGGR